MYPYTSHIRPYTGKPRASGSRMASKKRILVKFGESSRVFSLVEDDINSLIADIRVNYAGEIPENARIILQIKEEELNGEFVDIDVDNQSIPDKSILRVVVLRKV